MPANRSAWLVHSPRTLPRAGAVIVNSADPCFAPSRSRLSAVPAEERLAWLFAFGGVGGVKPGTNPDHPVQQKTPLPHQGRFSEGPLKPALVSTSRRFHLGPLRWLVVSLWQRQSWDRA